MGQEKVTEWYIYLTSNQKPNLHVRLQTKRILWKQMRHTTYFSIAASSRVLQLMNIYSDGGSFDCQRSAFIRTDKMFRSKPSEPSNS